MKAEVPKPLIHIAGKPMLVHLLERVRKAGIRAKPIVVVAPANRELFAKTLGQEVEYAIQREQLGTGDALRAAQELCKDAERVIVLYGDHPFIGEEVIQELNRLSLENPNALVMLTVRVPNFEGSYAIFKSWSRILRSADNRIIGDRQVKDASPKELEIRELNPCIFVFPTPWVWEHLSDITNKNANSEYYLTDLVKIAIETGMPIVTETVDPMQVMGVNTPEELQQAEAIYQHKL